MTTPKRDMSADSTEPIDHPSRIKIEGSTPAQRKASAEGALIKLVERCRADVQRGKTYLDIDFEPLGKQLIVNDYLLWSKKFESNASKGFYEARVMEIRSCITEQDRVAAQSTPNPFTENTI